jgi:predicted Zn-dependent peptidase
MKFTHRSTLLDGGTRVVTESNRSTGSVALGFWIGVGAGCEPPRLSGVSHFIEHILFKGTRRRSAFRLAHELESVGGSIDAFSGREVTAYVCRCLPEHLRRSVDVISDMICQPTMSSRDVALEKSVIFEEINNFEDTPEEVIHELLSNSVWKGDPLGNPILGNRRSVGAFSRRRVMPFFRAHYRPENIVVAATGRVKHDRLVDHVSRMLKLPGEPPTPTPASGKHEVPRIHSEVRDVSQCYICLGCEGPSYRDRARYANVLLSMILGGGMTSRLFQAVREKQGLAYSVYSAGEFYGETSLFMVFLAVDPSKARRAVASVARELRLLKRNGLRKGELRSVKQQLKGSLILGLESASARMSRLAKQELYLGEYRPPEHSLQRVLRTTTREVMRQAEELFQPSRFSMVSLGPESSDFPEAADLSF